MAGLKIDFICATNNEHVLERNLNRSPLFSERPIILQKGYTNVPLAYNDAMKKCKGDADVICFLHQDVFLPAGWEDNLTRSLSKLEKIDKNWAALGVAGVRKDDGGQKGRTWLGYLQDRGKRWGSPCGLPAEIETLDELLLILKNDGALKFDERIPTNHLYGADICLEARARGNKCYAINAYCHHNSSTRKLPRNFHSAAGYIKEKWSDLLPIATTCAILQEEI